MGKPGPNDSMIPPTAETVANTIDSNDMANGWAVILAAAAVGVMSRLSTSRAPTSCTAIALSLIHI